MIGSRTDAVAQHNGSVYFDISALQLVALCCAFYLLQLFADRFFPASDMENEGLLGITYADKAATLCCLFDSGNLLREPISGKRVIVVKQSAAAAILSPTQLIIAENLLNNKPPHAADEHLKMVCCSTINGERLLPAFSISCEFEKLAKGRRQKLPNAVIAVCKDEELPQYEAVAFTS